MVTPQPASAPSSAQPLVLASDLHLSASSPGQTAAFEALCGACRGGDLAVYLLGDVFDLWLGDDDDREPHGAAEQALRSLVDSGTPVFIQRGNHDMLLGDAFFERTRATPVPDEHLLEHAGQRLLLMHGDLLCTDDIEYLAFRKQAYETATRSAFLAMPLADRQAHAATLRSQSRSHTSATAADIMDVTDAAVRDALARHEADILVHGHTHRPADHVVGHKQRIVLSDWHRPPEVLLRTGRELRRVLVDALPAAVSD